MAKHILQDGARLALTSLLLSCAGPHKQRRDDVEPVPIALGTPQSVADKHLCSFHVSEVKVRVRERR
jgi:hypothetical protein